MIIRLNGEPRDVRAESILDLLSLLKLDKGMVAIELNGDILHRHRFESVKIKEHDKLEIVTVVGGG